MIRQSILKRLDKLEAVAIQVKTIDHEAVAFLEQNPDLIERLIEIHKLEIDGVDFNTSEVARNYMREYTRRFGEWREERERDRKRNAGMDRYSFDVKKVE